VIDASLKDFKAFFRWLYVGERFTRGLELTLF